MIDGQTYRDTRYVRISDCFKRCRVIIVIIIMFVVIMQ